MTKIKSGFSMVELLFVMAVMATLAAIAIPSLSGGSKAAALTSAKSDAQNTISTLQAIYVDEQDYGAISPNATTTYTEVDNTGKTAALTKGGALTISKNNTIKITTTTNNFVVSVCNSELDADKCVNFDSSADGKLQVSTEDTAVDN